MKNRQPRKGFTPSSTAHASMRWLQPAKGLQMARWMQGIRANVGRRHPDYGLTPAQRLANKAQRRAVPQQGEVAHG